MDIKRNLKLDAGALTHHLDVLEREKLVRSLNQGSRKLYCPADVPPAEDGGGLHELQRRRLAGPRRDHAGRRFPQFVQCDPPGTRGVPQ
jgi:hypothetical protein